MKMEAILNQPEYSQNFGRVEKKVTIVSKS